MHPSLRLFPALLELGLSSVALPDLGQAVTKLNLVAHKEHELLRDSNKRSLHLVLPPLLGASDRGPVKPSRCSNF